MTKATLIKTKHLVGCLLSVSESMIIMALAEIHALHPDPQAAGRERVTGSGVGF